MLSASSWTPKEFGCQRQPPHRCQSLCDFRPGERSSSGRTGEVAEQARLAMYETLAGSLVVMLLMGGVAFTIMRNITAGLTEIKGHFGRIAEGYYYDDIELGRG